MEKRIEQLENDVKVLTHTLHETIKVVDKLIKRLK